jgi:plasmid stabilization system protein ParE
MAIVLFHPLAAKEYRVAKAWYARRSHRAAQRFRDEVNAALDRVMPFPQSHPSFSANIQWIKVRRYPYLVVFQMRSTNVVFVVAVAHGRRKKGYWKRRI